MTGDRIKVNAGGRCFETTTTTLITSGAGYFQALLGPTGQALGHGAASATASEDAVGSSGRGTKRARHEDEGESAVPDGNVNAVRAGTTELFVDRSPDLFSDVLHFMRSGRLLSKTKTDLSRLEDLRAEADFFAYDRLSSAVDEASSALRAAVAEALKPEPEPEAECQAVVLGDGETCTISVPKGKILYIASATLAGECRVVRYKKYREAKKDVIEACYINCDHETSGDFQLAATIDDTEVVIAHVGLNHIHTCVNSGLDVNFRQDLGTCLSGGNDEEVVLEGNGFAEWHILYWVGDADAIPGIKFPASSSMDKAKAKRMRQSGGAQSDGEDDADDLAMVAAASLAMSSSTTNLAMMMAIHALTGCR